MVKKRTLILTLVATILLSYLISPYAAVEKSYWNDIYLRGTSILRFPSRAYLYSNSGYTAIYSSSGFLANSFVTAGTYVRAGTYFSWGTGAYGIYVSPTAGDSSAIVRGNLSVQGSGSVFTDSSTAFIPTIMDSSSLLRTQTRNPQIRQVDITISTNPDTVRFGWRSTWRREANLGTGSIEGNYYRKFETAGSGALGNFKIMALGAPMIIKTNFSAADSDTVDFAYAQAINDSTIIVRVTRWIQNVSTGPTGLALPQASYPTGVRLQFAVWGRDKY